MKNKISACNYFCLNQLIKIFIFLYEIKFIFNDNDKSLNNIIQLGGKNFRYNHFSLNSKGDMVIDTSAYPGNNERRFFGVKKNGRPYFKDQNNIESFYYSMFVEGLNNTNQQKIEGESIFVQITNNNSNLHGKEYYFTYSKGDGYVELYDFENKNYSFSKSSYYFNETLLSDVGALIKLNTSNQVYEYLISYIYLEKANKYRFYLVKFIIDTNNISNTQLVRKKPNYSKKKTTLNRRISSCFETISLKIVCLYQQDNYKYNIAVFDEVTGEQGNTTLAINDKDNITDNTNIFYKGIYFKGEIGVFLYYKSINDSYPIVSFKYINSTLGMETYNSYDAIKLDYTNFTVYAMLNDIIKLSDTKICLISSSYNKEQLNIVIFILYNQDQHMNINYYIINFFNEYSHKIYKDLRVFLYNNFISLAFSYCIKRSCENINDEYFSSLIIFNYPNSTDESIDYVEYLYNTNGKFEDFNFNLKEKITYTIENNIFGYEYVGIKILDYPDNISLTYVDNSAIISKNSTLSENKNITIQFIPMLSYIKTNYTIEYAIIVKEPNYSKMTKFINKTKSINNNLYQHYYNEEEYIGKTSYFNITIKENLTTECDYSTCSLCFERNIDYCVICLYNYSFNEEGLKICYPNPFLSTLLSESTSMSTSSSLISFRSNLLSTNTSPTIQISNAANKETENSTLDSPLLKTTFPLFSDTLLQTKIANTLQTTNPSKSETIIKTSKTSTFITQLTSNLSKSQTIPETIKTTISETILQSSYPSISQNIINKSKSYILKTLLQTTKSSILKTLLENTSFSLLETIKTSNSSIDKISELYSIDSSQIQTTIPDYEFQSTNLSIFKTLLLSELSNILQSPNLSLITSLPSSELNSLFLSSIKTSEFLASIINNSSSSNIETNSFSNLTLPSSEISSNVKTLLSSIIKFSPEYSLSTSPSNKSEIKEESLFTQKTLFNSTLLSIIFQSSEETKCNKEMIFEGKCSEKITMKQIEEIYNEIINEYILKNKSLDYVIMTQNAMFQLSTIEKQKNNEISISSIDFGKCESEIKKQEGLLETDELLILKLDLKNEDLSGTYVQYEVYNPYTKKKINMDICLNYPIYIKVPVDFDINTEILYISLNESGYNLFDLNDSFYNDVCSTYTSSNGTDITLTDRKNTIYNNNANVSLCQEGCEFDYYNSSDKRINCECQVQTTEIKSNINELEFSSHIFKNFIITLKNSNFFVLKCYKLAFSLNGQMNNIGSYFIDTIIFTFCIFLIIYGIKDKKKINRFILMIIKQKLFILNKKNTDRTLIPIKEIRIKKNNNLKIDRITKKIKDRIKEDKPEKDNIIIYKSRKGIVEENKKNEVEFKIKNINSPSKKKKKKFSSSSLRVNESITFSKNMLIKNDLLNQPSLKISKILKSKTNFFEDENLRNTNNLKPNITKKSIDNIKKDDDDINTNLNDEELNSLKYNMAIIMDQRTYFQYYWSLLKTKHIILFTFFHFNDYNLLSIKLALFLFAFSLYLTINAFFFTDKTMNRIYVDNGKYNLLYQIPQIIYSFLISTVINLLLKTLSLFEKDLLLIKKEPTQKLVHERSCEIKKRLKIKFIFFCIISLLLLFFFWYFITCFCAVYKNTQIILIKDTLVSYAITLLYPFALYLLPGVFRIPSLRAKNGDKKCLFDIGKIIAYI